MRKHPRREIEEPQPDDLLQADAEQIELDTFLDAIGAEGSVKVKLYRLTPTGKQVFIQEGPPSIFSESGVQAEHGGGDYLLRSLLNGRWHRSKAFSVAPTPGTPAVPVHLGSDAELERLKVQLETQRVQLERQQVQMEADRKERDQRNHELMLKILENTRHEAHDGYQGPTLPELIASVKDLRALSGEASAVSGFRETLTLLRENAGLLANGDGDAPDWKTILAAAVAPILPGIISQRTPGHANGAAPSATVSSPEPRPSATNPVPVMPDVPVMPTAYDQVAGQMRAVFERVRAQAANGLDCGFVLDNMLALEEQGDPVARLILNSFEKSETFEAWLIWLRSMIGAETMIDQATMGFLSNLFDAARALPKEEEEKEG